MNDSPLFNLYLTRKNTLNIEYRGVELKGILSEFLVNYSVSKTTNGLIRILKNLFLSIDPSKLSKLIDIGVVLGGNADAVFFRVIIEPSVRVINVSPLF